MCAIQLQGVRHTPAQARKPSRRDLFEQVRLLTRDAGPPAVEGSLWENDFRVVMDFVTTERVSDCNSWPVFWPLTCS